ncbi:MAG: hypothetical protein IPK74_11310 [Deltaproteobacteria bacterium]|nr:hypothetical protein [Deltaproteobacteria bacterium]
MTISLTTRAIALGVALALGSTVACDVDGGSAPEVQAERMFNGEELYDGLLFGLGPVGELVPELAQFDIDALSSDERAEFEAKLAEANLSTDDIENARDRLAHDEGFLAFRAQLIDQIRRDDPTFFPRFADAIQSGDHFTVAAALDEAADVTRAASEPHMAGRPNELTAAARPQGFAIGPVVFMVAFAVSAVAAGITIVATYEVAFWGGGGENGNSALTREKAVQLIVERLAVSA